MKEIYQIGIAVLFVASSTILNAQTSYQNLDEQYLNEINHTLLISMINVSGVKDTINLTDVINGTDKNTNFITVKGDTINYLTFRNKVILMDFWFLKCKACMVELPGLELVRKKIKSKDFEVITFSNNPATEIQDKFLSKVDWKLKVIPDVFLVSRNTYPFKIVTNKKTKIVDYKNQGNIGKNSIPRLLDRYLPLVRNELKK